MDLNDLLPAEEGRCSATSLFRDIPRMNAWQKVGVFVFTTFNRANKYIITNDLFTDLCVEIVFVQKRFVLCELGVKRYDKTRTKVVGS
jgi:hypothetical protein